jgi:hypothetical protein
MFRRDIILAVYFLITTVYVWFHQPLTFEMFFLLLFVGFGWYIVVAVNEVFRPKSKLARWMLKEIIIIIKTKN